MEKKPWFQSLIEIFNQIFDVLKTESEEKIKEIKDKVKAYIIIYGLFMVAFLFILIGLVKYLSEIYVFSSEGVGFMVVGSVIIVLLAVYTLLKKF